MRSLFRRFVDKEISRRDFGRGLVALGLSSAAAGSMTRSMALARDPLPAEGVRFTGTGAQILLETLRAAGIRYVFGTTSTGMSAFFDALTLNSDVALILSISESQATSMAHGYELASGETAALFVPGVAIPSTLNNLYNAWKDRSAIAVFADSPANRLPGRNMFQQMDDWLEPVKPFTKWRWQVDNDRQISEMVRRAIKVAGTPPGGPVHIRLPLNILGRTGITQTIYPQSRFSVPMNLAPKARLIEQAARRLLEARQPLISAGPEVTRAGANDELVALAELLGIPVAQGFSVFGDFPFRHPLFAGFYGLGVPDGLRGTDVFLNLGGQMPDPGLFTAPVPRAAKVIHARIAPDEIANVYPTDIAIAAGMKETIGALLEALRGMATADRLRRLSAPRLAAARAHQARRDAVRRQRAQAVWDASPLSWERVSWELDRALEEDAIIVPELNYRTPLHWLDLGRNRKWLVGQTTGFALGWGVGAAIGAKIAQPDRQVACLIGDGAFLFGQLEALWTAARFEVPVMMMVFNNRSYDNERNRIHAASPLVRDAQTRALWRDVTGYLGDPDVDFAAIAGSFGIPAVGVSTPDELVQALERARAVTREGRAFLIDAHIMQRAPAAGGGFEPAEKTWHPKLSIAAGRRRKV